MTIDYEEIDSSKDTIFSRTKIYDLTKNKEIKKKKDVFLLIYESYPNSETILQYGFNNREQLMFLKEAGFKIYPEAYSVASNSLSSMSGTLHVSSKPPKRSILVSGKVAVPNLLKYNGYKTYGIFASDYFFRKLKSLPSYHAFYPPVHEEAYKLLIPSILEGEFRFDASYRKGNYIDYLKRKRDILSGKNSKPVFLYTHNSYPGHSQNSGKCLPGETDKFLKRLVTANQEMKDDINIISKSNPEAIVIVAGDHGAHLTKNCCNLEDYVDASEVDRLDIQDRYGVLLAIKWPKDANIEIKNDIRVHQDIFPAILSYMYDDTSIMKSKIEQETIKNKKTIAGVKVRNGIIIGGKNDGEPLFLNGHL